MRLSDSDKVTILKELLMDVADQDGVVHDIWTAVKLDGKVFDIHYLYDEDRMVFVYEMIGDVRNENEYDMFEVK